MDPELEIIDPTRPIAHSFVWPPTPLGTELQRAEPIDMWGTSDEDRDTEEETS